MWGSTVKATLKHFAVWYALTSKQIANAATEKNSQKANPASGLRWPKAVTQLQWQRIVRDECKTPVVDRITTVVQETDEVKKYSQKRALLQSWPFPC